MTWNGITFAVWLLQWPIWLVWEVVLLLRRGAKVGEIPGLISMVAKDRAWSLSSIVYVDCGLATHFYWPGADWAGAAGTVAFWVIGLALFVWDVSLWRTDLNAWSRPLSMARTPKLWLVVGAVSGAILFPQYDARFAAVWGG